MVRKVLLERGQVVMTLSADARWHRQCKQKLGLSNFPDADAGMEMTYARPYLG